MKTELTTNEIFQESMKMSESAFKEKGEKLKVYHQWLQKKWKVIEDGDKIKNQGVQNVKA